MKKAFFIAGFAMAVVLTASAQTPKKDPPPPPKPPQPPVEMVGEVPPPPKPPKEKLPDDYKAFLKRNPSVKSLGWNFQNEVIVHLKSGKQERYKLDNNNSLAEAEAKYGKLPVPPPPPPPLPPAPPQPPHAPEPEYQ